MQGLYRGLGTSLGGIVPYAGIELTVLPGIPIQFRRFWQNLQKVRGQQMPSPRPPGIVRDRTMPGIVCDWKKCAATLSRSIEFTCSGRCTAVLH